MKDATDRILKTARKAAKALHRVGALDDRTMREMDRSAEPTTCPSCRTTIACEHVGCRLVE